MSIYNSPKFGTVAVSTAGDVDASPNEQIARTNVLMPPHDGHIDCPHGHDCAFWEGEPDMDEIVAHMQGHE